MRNTIRFSRNIKLAGAVVAVHFNQKQKLRLAAEAVGQKMSV
jgi:hypothetical protein